ncbi:hypothetical protein GQ53DRAFT_333445 [Thozetella sp. PMI_491]|nr:hypothetical protein GQ53DRAFT_333445 [Thozetella sp. PMI_491]
MLLAESSPARYEALCLCIRANAACLPYGIIAAMFVCRFCLDALVGDLVQSSQVRSSTGAGISGGKMRVARPDLSVFLSKQYHVRYLWLAPGTVLSHPSGASSSTLGQSLLEPSLLRSGLETWHALLGLPAAVAVIRAFLKKLNHPNRISRLLGGGRRCHYGLGGVWAEYEGRY